MNAPFDDVSDSELEEIDHANTRTCWYARDADVRGEEDDFRASKMRKVVLGGTVSLAAVGSKRRRLSEISCAALDTSSNSTFADFGNRLIVAFAPPGQHTRRAGWNSTRFFGVFIAFLSLLLFTATAANRSGIRSGGVKTKDRSTFFWLTVAWTSLLHVAALIVLTWRRTHSWWWFTQFLGVALCMTSALQSFMLFSMLSLSWLLTQLLLGAVLLEVASMRGAAWFIPLVHGNFAGEVD
ncbi:MAG: hypothetical protein MHM6MM_000523 [Cercozoa sp. M6MM]